MRFHVLGIGSVGTLVAHNLRQGNPTTPISLIVKHGKKFPSARRSDYASSDEAPSPTLSVTSQGSQSISTGYDLETTQTDVATSLAGGVQSALGSPGAGAAAGGPGAFGPISSLVVCLKTLATGPAISRLAPRLSPSSVITLLQNGMGVYDELCRDIFPDPATRPYFILGSTTHGASPGNRAGSVIYNSLPGKGKISLGVVPDPRKEVDLESWIWGYGASKEPILAPPQSPSLPLPTPPITSSVGLANLHATLEGLMGMKNLHPGLLPMPHLHHELLLKVAVNSMINPLTAILGGGHLPNKMLVDGQPSFRLLKYLARETSSVLVAYLQNLAAPRLPAPDVLRLFTTDSLERRARGLCRITGTNISSMAQDVLRGQLTEIEHINGYIISLGKRLGVATPNHRLIVEMVKWLTESNGLGGKGDSYVQVSAAKRSKASQLVRDKRQASNDAESLRLKKRELWIEEQKIRVEGRKLALEEDRVAKSLRERRKASPTYVSGLVRLAQRNEKRAAMGLPLTLPKPKPGFTEVPELASLTPETDSSMTEPEPPTKESDTFTTERPGETSAKATTTPPNS